MNIYEQAVAEWGIEAQIDMLKEECAEVILSICHMRRGRCGTRAMIEEMVDVEIMLEQMRTVFPLDVWAEIKEKKLLRLAETLKKSEAKHA